MVKANELRIGNWIADHEAGGYFQVERIYKNEIGEYRASYRNGSIDCTIDALEPIPLTEEKLIEFGFDYLYISDNGITFRFEKIGSDWICHICYSIILKIQYVHTLQNIYFALTGDELETKGGNNE